MPRKAERAPELPPIPEGMNPWRLAQDDGVLIRRLDGLMSGLPPDERAAVQHILHEFSFSPGKEIVGRIEKRDFVDARPPVHPSEFYENPYYLGEWGRTIYPVWKRDLCIVLDPEKRYEEWALVGAQGTGKSTAALAAQLYKLYRVSCLANPQQYFELDKVSRIYFGLFSLNMEKSKTVLHDKLIDVLNQSPYFRERFPSRRVGGRYRIQRGLGDALMDETHNEEIVFPHNLRLVSGSLTSHALSIDLMSAILDEMNWRRKKTVRPEEDVDSALSLYEQVRNRIRGRFLTKHQTNPGLVCTISSKRATTDFMDVLVARMRREPDRCYVSDYALWEAKPGKVFSGKRFHVFVGGSYGQTRILSEEEATAFGDGNSSIVPIPEEFRPEFDANPNAALRDIAGISTVPYHLLFERETLIRAVEDPSRKSPFTVDEVPLGLNDPTTIDRFVDESALVRHDGFAYKPIFGPTLPRYVHVDLSKSGDATGLSMLCPYETRTIESTTGGGKVAEALVPLVHVDLTIRIRAIQGDQIDYDKIRQFIVYLRRLGFRIANVSFDQYQSVDSLQLLAKAGFRTSYVSVDRTDLPYVALRQAFAQKRLSLYRYDPLVRELRQLVHDLETEKVDHPEMDEEGGPGRKDVADSLCGAYAALIQAMTNRKPTAKVPTTVDVASLARESRTPPEAPSEPSATDYFQMADEAEAFHLRDWMLKERIREMKTGGKG